MKCIICKKDKLEDKFNLEHVFPEAIGGSIVTNSVCSECNSRFGTTVDKKFSNSRVIKIISNRLDVRTKKGKIPKMFPEVMSSNDDPSIKADVHEDSVSKKIDSTYKTKLVIEDGVLKNISYDSRKSEAEVLMDIENEFKKRNIQFTDETKQTILEKIKNDYDESFHELVHKEEIDNDPLILECIKIAYECSCLKLGEKYHDDSISLMLEDYLSRNKLDSYFRDNLLRFFDYNDKDVKKRHGVSLEKIKNNILCTVSLFDAIVCKFVVSVSSEDYEIDEGVFFQIACEIDDGSEEIYLEDLI